MSEKYVGTGSIYAGGFDVYAKSPLDNRTVIGNWDKLNDIPTTRLYEGLIIYVEEEKCYYGLIVIAGSVASECTWEKLGSAIEWEDIDSLLEENNLI